MPSAVQVVSGKVNSSSTLTLTFTNDITPGNALVVCVAGPNGAGVPAPSPASGGDTFLQAVAITQGTGSIWYVLSSGGGYQTITIDDVGNSYGMDGWAYEMPPAAALDQVAYDFNNSAASTFTSSATPTTTSPAEFAVGMGVGSNSGTSTTASGPGSGWTNLTSENEFYAGASHYGVGISGYQFLSATGTVTYSGTFASSRAIQGACVATFSLGGTIGVRVNGSFGTNGFVPTFGPELGLQYGF